MNILKLLLISAAAVFLIGIFIEREVIINFAEQIAAEKLYKGWKPTDEYIKEHNLYKPELLLDQKEFENSDESNYKIVKEFDIGSTDDAQYNFNGLKDIAIDMFGDVYILDGGDKKIQVFDSEGNFLRSIEGRNKFPPVPVGISINPDNIIAVAGMEKKKIYLISDNGKFLNKFSLPFEPVEIKSLDKGFIILGIYKHFLIHRYSKDGRRTSAFCPLIMNDMSDRLRKNFNTAHLDIDFNDKVFVTYEYEYRIAEFDNRGTPVRVFNRSLPDNPSLSINKNKADSSAAALEQKISLSIAVDSEGNIYNLLKGVETNRGDRIDKFDEEGHYLYTFYLNESIDDFVLYGTDVIWCLTGKDKNKVTKYRIVKEYSNNGEYQGKSK
ncbi:hypothetical protein KAS50_00640 [bacterium]|nr:hypothetical protein [bacterium]